MVDKGTFSLLDIAELLAFESFTSSLIIRLSMLSREISLQGVATLPSFLLGLTFLSLRF